MTRGERIIQNAGIEYSRDVDISRLCTIGVLSRAALLANPTTTDELARLVYMLCVEGIPYHVVGGMSNVLPSGELYNGVLVLTRRIDGKSINGDMIFAECGATLSSIVNLLMQNGLGGLAQLYHIPGTLGGAVRGNSGAFGLEISDVLECATVYLPDLNEKKKASAFEMQFGYRTSVIKTCGGIVLSAVLKAVPRDNVVTAAEISRLSELRASQPRGVRTLGSTFKRVNGKSAGYYIDRCGLKGLAVGGAAVSEIHAGFIINRGGATPYDVLTLIDLIKDRVYNQFGVLLEEEIDHL